MITGEPMPVEKTIGSTVVGEQLTKVAANIKATSVGSSSVFLKSSEWLNRHPSCLFRHWLSNYHGLYL